MFRKFSEIDIGEEIGRIERAIPLKEVEEFCACWGSPGPNLFLSPEVARRQGLPNPILPGPLCLVYMFQLLNQWAPGVQIKSLDVVLRQNIFHNVPIRMSGVVTDTSLQDGKGVVQIELKMENLKGERLIGGTAVVTLPANIQ